ncbi:limonene-1,2-epoxide hydrolase family protein [Sphingobium sp. YR768]|uniref:limonene-1,2-epoxide hydrolase family protein n=1 Tax=Sphingobium sp. YR768 TaxID=1884365 RepID=UPI0008CA1232|nr:limonene-1,2-epoxide hydrolase family protein [Sphingobium sp. YR768]SES21578.1 limonene-1,2-epoxide hydrolase [Sphingobium sp. YR768]
MSAQRTVEDFLDAWSGGIDAIRCSFQGYFTDQTVWENVGMSTTVGAQQGLSIIDEFERTADMGAIIVDMMYIATDGNRVLTERIDRIMGKDGSEKLAIRLMGIFEVEGGKIVHWRDYFDTAPLTVSN